MPTARCGLIGCVRPEKDVQRPLFTGVVRCNRPPAASGHCVRIVIPLMQQVVQPAPPRPGGDTSVVTRCGVPLGPLVPPTWVMRSGVISIFGVWVQGEGWRVVVTCMHKAKEVVCKFVGEGFTKRGDGGGVEGQAGGEVPWIELPRLSLWRCRHLHLRLGQPAKSTSSLHSCAPPGPDPSAVWDSGWLRCRPRPELTPGAAQAQPHSSDPSSVGCASRRRPRLHHGPRPAANHLPGSQPAARATGGRPARRRWCLSLCVILQAGVEPGRENVGNGV